MKNYLILNQSILLQVRYWGFMSLIALLMLNACKGGGGSVSTKHAQIPQDAHFVFTANLKNLTSKAKNWKEVFDKDFFESADIDSKEFREFGEKIIHTGIDFEQTAYMFGKIDKEKKGQYVAVSFLLKDPAQFEKALAEGKEKPQIKTTDGMKYYAKDKAVIGWKGVSALMVAYEEKIGEDKLLEQIKTLFKTSAGESLVAKNKELSDLLGKNHDFAFWMDAQKVNENNSQLNDFKRTANFIEDIIKLSKYYTMSFDFKNGEIEMDGTTFLDKDLSKKYQAVLKEGIHQKVIKNIPFKSPSAMLGLGLGMKGLYELAKEEASVKDSEGSLKEMGLTLKESFEMFSGDFLLATADLKVKQMMEGKYEPDFALVIGIGDKKSFDKLIKYAQKSSNGMMEDRGDFYLISGGPYKVYVIEKNEALYITMSESYKNAIVSGKAQLESRYTSMADGNSYMFYMNWQDIFKQIPAEVTDENKEFREIMLPELLDLEMESGTIKNDQIQGKFIFRFTNKNQNALVTMAEIGKKMNKAQKEKKKEKVREPISLNK